MPLFLYLYVTNDAMSSVLVQELDDNEKQVYFVSRVFRGAELRYQKIERLSSSLVATTRKLNAYFHGHQIMFKTNYHIHQVLKKSDLERSMVS